MPNPMNDNRPQRWDSRQKKWVDAWNMPPAPTVQQQVQPLPPAPTPWYQQYTLLLAGGLLLIVITVILYGAWLAMTGR